MTKKCGDLLCRLQILHILRTAGNLNSREIKEILKVGLEQLERVLKCLRKDRLIIAHVILEKNKLRVRYRLSGIGENFLKFNDFIRKINTGKNQKRLT